MRLSPLLALAPVALLLGASQQVPTPAGAVFDGGRIRDDVAFLADDKLEGRFTLAPGYFTAATYIADRFQKLGLKPGGDNKGWLQIVTVRLPGARETRVFRSANVVGLLPGTDPKLKDEYVVLSAHLDHLGLQKGAPGKDKIYNGAMDNAAGVATMLEAAQAFIGSGKAPRRSILFVALAGEEEGLFGSEYLANHPVTGSGKVVADVNLDMPILLYDFQDVVALGADHSTLGPMVEAVATKMGLTLSPDPMPLENDFVRSDHYSFIKAGVPSVFLELGFKNGGEKATREFLKKRYHQVNDDMTQAFDWRAAAKFAKLNYLVARAIADADEAPRWYKGDQYGDRYGRGQPRAPKP